MFQMKRQASMRLIVSLLVIPGALAAEEPQAQKSPTIHETLSAGAPSLELTVPPLPEPAATSP